jgi:hypothetical protein
MLLAVAHWPTRGSVRVDRWGLKLSSTIAIRTPAGYSERRYRQKARNSVRPFRALT